MKALRLLFPFLLLAALAGCATLTADQCRVADWRALGVEDGALGYGEQRFLDHVKACSGSGAAPERAAWEAGREEGLRRFCTPEGAYYAAVDGRPYQGICEAETPETLEALEKGRNWRAITLQIQSLEREIDVLTLRPYPFPYRRFGHPFGFSRDYAYYSLIRLEVADIRDQIAVLREERSAYAF